MKTSLTLSLLFVAWLTPFVFVFVFVYVCILVFVSVFVLAFVLVFVGAMAVLTVRVLDLAERTGHETGAGLATGRLQVRVTGVAEVTPRVPTEHRPRLLAGVPAGQRTLPEGKSRRVKNNRSGHRQQVRSQTTGQITDNRSGHRQQVRLQTAEYVRK